MKLAVFFCIFCMFAVYSAQSAPLYRWVDSSGKVHYTDQPPPASAKEVEEKNLNVPPPDNDSLPYASRMAAKNFPVTLYNSGCGVACTNARDHLIKRGIPFNEKDAGAPEVQEELKALIGNVEVPVLAVGKITRLKGYETSAWDAALDEAGYPKSAPALKLKPKAPAKAETKGDEKNPATGNK
ncbi:MAG: glutaredoxin family protein [Betaproteobacteria bacterium]|nr:glutaredoxin family protein [Betaproteobacteria bacterium]